MTRFLSRMSRMKMRTLSITRSQRKMMMMITMKMIMAKVVMKVRRKTGMCHRQAGETGQEDKKWPCEPVGEMEKREIYNSTTHRKQWMAFSRRMESQGANFPEMSKLWTGSRDATHLQCQTACSGFYAAFRLELLLHV